MKVEGGWCGWEMGAWYVDVFGVQVGLLGWEAGLQGDTSVCVVFGVRFVFGVFCVRGEICF